MKKRIITILLALTMLMTMICAAVVAEGNAFADVPEKAFFYEAVNWAQEEGITQGMHDGLFHPDELCNRAQVVTFLWRLEGRPTVSGRNHFIDVEQGSWYADAVQWAVVQKITQGMGENTFQPNTICNRGQIVTFLWRYAGKPTSDSENPFADVSEDAFYYEAVKWAVENGITNGLTDTTFGPDVPCNRAQVVTFLYRYAMQANEPPVTEPTEPDWGMGEVEF